MSPVKARRHSRLTGVALLGLLLLGGAAGPAGASRGTPGGLQLDVPGDALGFRDGPFGPLFAVTGFVPGAVITVDVGARNSGAPTSRLDLRALEVVGLDNTCAPPEDAVDATCGTGTGELPQDVRFEIRADFDDDADDSEFGAAIFEGTIHDLAEGITLGDDLASGDEWFFRITAGLPAEGGNETMTDSLVFDLEWRITGDAEVIPGDGTGPGIPGADLVAGPAAGGGLGTDVLGGRILPLPGSGILPLTGANRIWAATAGALGLFLVGLAMRTTGRRRSQ